MLATVAKHTSTLLAVVFLVIAGVGVYVLLTRSNGSRSVMGTNVVVLPPSGTPRPPPTPVSAVTRTPTPRPSATTTPRPATAAATPRPPLTVIPFAPPPSPAALSSTATPTPTATPRPPTAPGPPTASAAITPSAPATLPVPQAPVTLASTTPSPAIGASSTAEVVAPKQLDVGQSGSVSVSFYPGRGQPSSGAPPDPAAPLVGGSPTAPVPPGATSVRLTAEMDAVAFNKAPASQDEKPLGSDTLTWRWSVSSDQRGSQVVLVRVLAVWSTPSGPETDELWSAGVDIDIRKPLFSAGQIEIGSLVSGLLASGLSIPFLLGIVRSYRNRDDEKDQEGV